MKNFKFYVLTSKDSKNLKCLTRHIHEDYSAIPKEDLVVVINTQDADYEKKAKQWCESQEIEYHITESNGTAGRGKNSVLDIFLKSDQDYFVMIDGDDYLTPHGVWMYNAVSQQKSPPDAICLKNQIALVWDMIAVNKWLEETGNKGKDYREFQFDMPDDIIMVKPHQIFSMTKGWEHNLSGLMQNEHANRHQKIESKMYYAKQRKYSEHNEAHCRVTWYSKKAAKIRFKESLLVGEDTHQYYLLKNENYQGNIEMCVNIEKPPTYLYDTSNPGVVCEVGNYGEDNHQWLFPFNLEICNMEKSMMLHENYFLPELKVDYPTDYIPEVFGVTSNYIWDVDIDDTFTMQIEHPANCSDKSLEEKYKSLI